MTNAGTPLRRGIFRPAPAAPIGRRLLWITVVCALASAAICVTDAVISVLTTMLARHVEVALPVTSFWPKLKPSVHPTGLTAHVTSGGFTTAHVQIAGLHLGTRILLAAGDLLVDLTGLTLALVIALLCLRLLRGTVFSKDLSLALFVSAITIAVGGIAWQICYDIGNSLAAQQVLTMSAWSMKTGDIAGGISNTGLPGAGMDGTVAFWPIFAALAITAIGIAFRYGSRIQGDKVRAESDAARLRRDAEGLV